MAMLFCAAESGTAAEIRNALGYSLAGIDKDDIPSIFEEQMSALLKNPEYYNFACANSMLSQKGFEIKDQYKSILSDCFKALLLEVDFLKGAEETVNHINEWVKEKTRNRIPKLVESLDPSTVMVLMNAVYFKGSWSLKFDKKSTSKQNFFNNGLDDNAVEVDMMYMKEDFHFTENDKFQALQLPFAGEEVVMFIILPRPNVKLDSVESSLSPSLIQRLKKSVWKRKVVVSLPRFRLEYSKPLVHCFQRLGIERLFKKGAELGIASDSPDLAVSEIIHKAVVEVNEEGSEAAALTVIDVEKVCDILEAEFRADHPFLFMIYDTKNDLILFMGRVQDL